MGVPCGKICNDNPREAKNPPRATSFLQGVPSNAQVIEVPSEIQRKPLMIKAELRPKRIDIVNFLAEFQKKIVIVNLEGYKKIFFEEKDGMLHSCYLIDKEKYGQDLLHSLNLVKSLPSHLDFFQDVWELFEDEKYLVITQKFPKNCKHVFEFLMDSRNSIPPTVSSKMVEKLVQVSQFTNSCDLSLMLNPSYMFIDESFRIIVDTPMSLLNLPDRRLNFADLLFHPPEYITSQEVKVESIIFTIASIIAFVFYDKLVYDKSKYTNLLKEEYTLEVIRSLNQGGNEPFFKKALEYYPKSRKFLIFAGPKNGFSQFCSEARRTPQIAMFLMSFGLFAGEFYETLRIMAKAEKSVNEASLLTNKNVHYLTFEQVVDEIRSEIDPLKLERNDELTKALQKSKKNSEYCDGADFLQKLRDEKLQRLMLKFKIINEKLQDQPDIDLKSYLSLYESLTDAQSADIIQYFKMTLRS